MSASLRISLAGSFTLICVALAAGCIAEPDWECRRSTDCSGSEFCRAGTCMHADEGDVAARPPANDVGVISPDAAEAGATGCPEGDPPQEGDLVINEALVNVPLGQDGDANGDGLRDAFDDEFVEVVNRSEETVDVTGVKVGNSSDVRFTFGAECLEPQEGAVVYGGGHPVQEDDASKVYVADSRFAFSNEAGTVTLFDRDKKLLSTLAYEASPEEALTLDPQLEGESFVPHSQLSEERVFSPGRCADGEAFTEGCEASADAGL
ncbi:MAG: lamin tail domain-containing protein [Persicimonas sp.]